MKLTTIEFTRNNLKVEMEKNLNDSYSISIQEKSSPDEPISPLCLVNFRTDEVDINDLIEVLKFCQKQQDDEIR